MENRFMKPLEGFENNSDEIKTQSTEIVEQTVASGNQDVGSKFMKTLGSPETTDTVQQSTDTVQQSAGNLQNSEKHGKTMESLEKPGKTYSLDIRNLTHTFDKGTEHEFKIFENFTLQVEDVPKKSEVVSLMGGSGCGKSCILRMAAGLMIPQEGDIRILGRHIDQYKSVPMVFQSYSSFEWMTVLDNVALPMVIKGTDKKSAREKAYDILSLVDLEQQATKYAKPSVLSGGQLQRVSIARCLASDSPVFFLDEATGALDIKMKREIQDLIIKIASETEHTIVNVTHSVEEALYISDKIFILKPNPCTIHKEMDISYGDNLRGRWVFDTDTYREYSRVLSSVLDEVCK